MRIGIPDGLLYPDFRVMIETFFTELGTEIVVSPATNRAILDLGVNCCVDEACLPVKVFHGHVRWLAENGSCDMIFIPRIMRLRKNESICPKFCGLTEMVRYSIPGIPPLIGIPIDWSDDEGLRSWAGAVAKLVGRRRKDGQVALAKALHKHNGAAGGYAKLQVDSSSIARIRSFQQCNIDQAPRSSITIALLGHPYNVKDNFLNMNIAEKLARMGVRIVTGEAVPEECVNKEASALFKRPFWTFARYTYGAACRLCKTGSIDGMIYISSFACGIDSVTVELIRCETEGTPLLVLKVDEHTGEAGIDTRIEAFIDLLGRRKVLGSDDTAYGQRLSCS